MCPYKFTLLQIRYYLFSVGGTLYEPVELFGRKLSAYPNHFQKLIFYRVRSYQISITSIQLLPMTAYTWVERGCFWHKKCKEHTVFAEKLPISEKERKISGNFRYSFDRRFSTFQPARKDFRFHYKDNGVIVIPQFRSVIGVAKESCIINQNIGSDSI